MFENEDDRVGSLDLNKKKRFGLNLKDCTILNVRGLSGEKRV